MTKKIKFALMSAAFVAGAALTSCSSDSPATPSDNNVGNLLLKSPQMIAYTSNQSLGEYGTKAEDLGEGEVTVQPYVSHNDIEVNLTVNDKITEPGVAPNGDTFDKDVISSHLSIHVRTPRDVKVTLPVAKTLVCDADDMEIVKKHIEEGFVYGDENHTLTMDIAGQTVTLTIAYNDNDITITTSGINETVISHLAENYMDGITFEIWNYYNTTTSREDLRDLLNGATVEFLDGYDNVDYYVNAFNSLRTYDEKDESIVTSDVVNPWDCTVSIVADQQEGFVTVAPDSEEYWEGHHGYNASQYNKVFRNKAVVLDQDDNDEPENEPEGE